MLRTRSLWLRLQTLFRRDRIAQRLDEKNIAVGMNTEETGHDAVLRASDNPALQKEQRRETSGWVLLEPIGKDLRYAVRVLRASPLFTLTAILSLALGIGANTGIFTLLHASLWRPLPVKDPEQIFHLMRASSGGEFADEFSYSYPLFQQFSKIAGPWGEIFATSTFGSRRFSLDQVSNERVAGEAVSANFFSALQVEPFLGRVIEP